MKELAKQFKIKFDKKSKRYAKVFIFRDKQTMYKFYSLQLERTGQKPDNGNFEAMFQPFEIIKIKGKKETIKNHTGIFLFYKENIGSGVVTHECGHAALHWFELKHKCKDIINMDFEEDFLWTLGYLVAQFWSNYYKIFKN